MDKDKQARLEKKGWKVGTVDGFLGLTPDEAAYIELKLALSQKVRDYRLSIADWLLIPLQDCFDGSSKEYWWPKMQCLAHAFEDWRVAELLG